MFYEVNFDEETRVLLEGQASGAIAKGGSDTGFIPDDALDNSIDLIQKIVARMSTEVMPSIDGQLCSMEVSFSIRADGNGTIMLAQTPEAGQFRVTIKRPVIKRTTSPARTSG